MTNMTGFDDEIKEWSANWNDPGYWHDAAADALWSSNDGAYWTTRDEDPSDAVMARHRRIADRLELDADNLIERTPENIGLLHNIVDTVHGMDPESDLRILPRLPVRNRPRNRRRASHRWRDRGENHVRRMEPRQGPVSEGQQGRRLGRHGPDHRGPARMGQPHADPEKRRRIRGRHAGRPHRPRLRNGRNDLRRTRESAGPWTGVDPTPCSKPTGRPFPIRGIDPNSGNGPMDSGIGM